MPLPEQQRRDFSFNNAIKLNRRAERSADQPDLHADNGSALRPYPVGGHRRQSLPGRKGEAHPVAQRQTEPAGRDLQRASPLGQIKINVEDGNWQIRHRLVRLLRGEAAAHQYPDDLGDVGGGDACARSERVRYHLVPNLTI